MENVPHWVFALLGILRIGGVAVPLAPALPENSVQRLCSHAECRLVFSDAQNLEKARSTKADVILLPSDDILQSSAPVSAFQAPKDDETALIIYTSGTTGDPKGVEITLFNLAHEIRGVAESFELSASGREWHRSTLHWSGGNFSIEHLAAAHRGVLSQAPHYLLCMRPAVFLRSAQEDLFAGGSSAFHPQEDIWSPDEDCWTDFQA
jgi:acyl-CoA synthetase (AMP-forming)/AMP-acid ligase II